MKKDKNSPSIVEVGKQIHKAKLMAPKLGKGEHQPVQKDAAIIAYKDEDGQCWWLDAVGFSRVSDAIITLDGKEYHGKKITND